jgi:MFS family permease
MTTISIERPLDIRRSWLYYGWVNVVIAAVAMGATFPGRTHGLGLFTTGILRDFDLTEQRGFYGTLNLGASLLGALFCLPIGVLIDRVGSRLVLTAIYACFGASVLWLSQAGTWQELFGALLLTRGFGQSALSVVSITLVAKWFKGRSLSAAMAMYAVLLALLFAVLFQLVSYGLNDAGWDWREVLAIMGWTLCAGLAPVSSLLTRSEPRSPLPAENGTRADERLEGATLWEALATPAFWVFSLAVSLYGLVSSGIFIFNAEIFRDNQLAADVYPMSMTILFVVGLPSNFLAAWLAGRWGIHRLLAVSMALMVLALLALPWLREAWQAYLYAVVMAVAGGVVGFVFFALWGQAFGRREVGRIQAIAQMLTVLASAVGPPIFGFVRDQAGSYLPVFLTLAPVALVLAVACWWTGLPERTWDHASTTTSPASTRSA